MRWEKGEFAMKVRIFKLLKGFEGNVDFQNKINDWLAGNEVEVFEILQSECEDDLTISIFYKVA